MKLTFGALNFLFICDTLSLAAVTFMTLKPFVRFYKYGSWIKKKLVEIMFKKS